MWRIRPRVGRERSSCWITKRETKLTADDRWKRMDSSFWISAAPFNVRTPSNCIGDEIRDKCQWFRDVIESSGRLFSQDENVATRINVRFYSNRLRGKIGRQIRYRTFSKITSYFLVKADFPILYRSFCSILRVSFLRSFHRYLCVFRRFVLIISNRCFYRFAAIACGARVKNFYVLYSLISFVDFSVKIGSKAVAAKRGNARHLSFESDAV